MSAGTILRSASICRRLATMRSIPATRFVPEPFRPQIPQQQSWSRIQRRTYATEKSLADERIEEIQEQYATARDEFEIAVEETDKKTVYAADDRAAAADEFAKLKDLYEAAIKDSTPDVAKEIQSRVGQRIRELDQAIQGLEKSAMED